MKKKTVLIKATCAHCGRAFNRSNPRQKYHADRCRIAACRAKKRQAEYELAKVNELKALMRGLAEIGAMPVIKGVND